MTDRQHILEMIALLLSSFPPHQGGSPEMVLSAFLMAIEDQPVAAIERAVRLFVQGKVEGHDGRFAPSSAQFGRFVRERAELMQQLADSQKSIANGLARPEHIEGITP